MGNINKDNAKCVTCLYYHLPRPFFSDSYLYHHSSHNYRVVPRVSCFHAAISKEMSAKLVGGRSGADACQGLRVCSKRYCGPQKRKGHKKRNMDGFLVSKKSGHSVLPPPRGRGKSIWWFSQNVVLIILLLFKIIDKLDTKNEKGPLIHSLTVLYSWKFGQGILFYR